MLTRIDAMLKRGYRLFLNMSEGNYCIRWWKSPNLWEDDGCLSSSDWRLRRTLLKLQDDVCVYEPDILNLPILESCPNLDVEDWLYIGNRVTCLYDRHGKADEKYVVLFLKRQHDDSFKSVFTAVGVDFLEIMGNVALEANASELAWIWRR